MAYTINLTDGNLFATIADGTINNASSMTLVGKNYAGYGEFLDENFIHLLENGSNTTAPAAPLTGQLWWDKTNSLLKVYNGTTFKTISAATASASAPSSNVIGDLWYDTINQQLKVWTGAAFIVVGPAYTSSTGLAGAVPETIVGTTANVEVTSIFVANQRIAVFNRAAGFEPVSTSGFPFIATGLTFSNAYSGISFYGSVANTGNVTISSGNVTTVTVTSTGANIAGYANVTGNITAGNIVTFGQFSLAGNVTAGNIITPGLITATGNITVGNVTTARVVANTTVSATGNIDGGNVRTVGLVSASGNVTGGNIITGGLVTATGTIAATGNITGGNIITGGSAIVGSAVTATGNIVSTSGVFVGNGAGLTNIVTGAGSIIESGTSNVKVNGTNGNVTVSVAGTGNLIVVSTSTSAFSTSITVPSIAKSGSNAVGNIGSSSNYFNQVFATATTALYADLAERFAADDVYTPGTVVMIGGVKEITLARGELTDNVLGVVSTNPAYRMNDGAGLDATHPLIALAGRVPVRVTGPVHKGERLVLADAGIARAAQEHEATPFNVIGRSLETKTSEDEGLVEAIVSIK
jgi:hypothetical protein